MKENKKKIDSLYNIFELIENRERASDTDELFKFENESAIYKEVFNCLAMALNNQPCSFQFPF